MHYAPPLTCQRIRLTSSFGSTITTVQKHSQGVGYGNLQQTSPARAVQGGDARASLQHPHGTILLALDSLFHPFASTACPAEVNAFLTWLAVERKVAAATQNLALNVLAFLYDKVLQQPIGQVGEVGRVKRLARIPCVLTHA